MLGWSATISDQPPSSVFGVCSISTKQTTKQIKTVLWPTSGWIIKHTAAQSRIAAVSYCKYPTRESAGGHSAWSTGRIIPLDITGYIFMIPRPLRWELLMALDFFFFLVVVSLFRLFYFIYKRAVVDSGRDQLVQFILDFISYMCVLILCSCPPAKSSCWLLQNIARQKRNWTQPLAAPWKRLAALMSNI